MWEEEFPIAATGIHSLIPHRHDRKELQEEIERLDALDQRLARGLREAYDSLLLLGV